MGFEVEVSAGLAGAQKWVLIWGGVLIWEEEMKSDCYKTLQTTMKYEVFWKWILIWVLKSKSAGKSPGAGNGFLFGGGSYLGGVLIWGGALVALGNMGP